jgi:hypothetical protein
MRLLVAEAGTMSSTRVLLTAVLWSIVAAASRADVLTVDCTGSGDFLTLQAAVEAAAIRDTLIIAPCVYEEQVVIAGKALTLKGSGANVTELRWASPDWENALDINVAGSWYSTVEDLTITRDPPTLPAVYFHEQTLIMNGCVVSGRVKVGRFYGEVLMQGSDLTELAVEGGDRHSVVEDCRIGRAYFSGVFRQAPQSVSSSGCAYDSLSLGSLTGFYSVRDSIGAVELYGGPDVYHCLEADESTVTRLVCRAAPYVELRNCRLADLTYDCYWDGPCLGMWNCLVSGAFARLEHNTFLSDVDVACAWDFTPPDHHFRDNIVSGAAVLDFPGPVVITHNDFVGGASITAPSDSVLANLALDPLFCDPSSADYTLQDCSPCAGAAHDGTDIGAYGIACACTAVRKTTWGALKAMFR